MKRSPMAATILFGLACGLLFVPVLTLLRPLFGGTPAFRLALWLCLAGYAIFLAGRGETRFSALPFPLGMAAVLAFVAPTRGIFLFLSLVTLAWIRSGVSVSGGLFRRLASEILLTAGGAGLVMVFAPRTPLQWALGIWLFFVIQSLYFAGNSGDGPSDDGPDPFERARREAERILSGTPGTPGTH